MEYRYVGYSLDEGIIKGKIEADDAATAKEDIIDKGYKVLEIKAVKQLPGMRTRWGVGPWPQRDFHLRSGT